MPRPWSPLTPLSDALSALLPDGGDTLLLRAILWTGPAARDAWTSFERDAGDLRELFRADHGRRKRLGPLVAAALRRNEIAADPKVLTVLRTASLREELRADLYQDILAESLVALADAGVNTLVLRGAAFGRILYEEPAHRHSHDIDLLCRSRDLEAAAVALERTGLRRIAGPEGEVRLEHRRALPINLHTSLLESPGREPDFDELWSRSTEAPLTGVALQTLSPADHLFHVLTSGIVSRSRSDLQWACDAWRLIERFPGLAWEVFLGLAERGAHPVLRWAVLEYLAEALGAAIPAEVQGRVRGFAQAAPPIERDQALYLARAAPEVGVLAQVRRGSSLRAKVQLARWALFPSAEYLRATHGGTGTLPVLYLRRLLRRGTARFRSDA